MLGGFFSPVASTEVVCRAGEVKEEGRDRPLRDGTGTLMEVTPSGEYKKGPLRFVLCTAVHRRRRKNEQGSQITAILSAKRRATLFQSRLQLQISVFVKKNREISRSSSPGVLLDCHIFRDRKLDTDMMIYPLGIPHPFLLRKRGRERERGREEIISFLKTAKREMCS